MATIIDHEQFAKRSNRRSLARKRSGTAAQGKDGGVLQYVKPTGRALVSSPCDAMEPALVQVNEATHQIFFKEPDSS